MKTRLSHHQWKRDGKTVELLPYLSSPSPLKLSFCSKKSSFSFANSHVGQHSELECHADCGIQKITSIVMLRVWNMVEMN